MSVQVAPSLLAADYAHLADEVRRIEDAGATVLHLDIMDGHFVPNLSFGADLVAALRPLTKMLFDVHLMVTAPENYLQKFAAAGADEITVHLEAAPHLDDILAQIAALKIKRGVSLNPDTPVEKIRPHLDRLDLVLLMSVYPGAGGQPFMPEALDRLRECRQLVGQRPVVLSIDGGVRLDNAPAIRAAGATRLVSGTTIFHAPNPQRAVAQLEGRV
ncbi:ribulose-phosphate 3-epimerase [Planctomycetales bacterium]|nr:ribulose-phosphate 3-epimerase [Planctomycetales bacterium]GHT05107.1 ribulose-phosphate 3-epimerase [Planctomycetales bacterium]GHV20650.1 ribulose-phosphate 3-epimerase [Planctomycetales bacterium]